VQKKAAKVGFDWPDVSGAMDKLSEELGELSAAINGDGDVTEELGDLLFAAVNAARFLKVDPEDALGQATDKFAARFRRVEETVTAQGKRMEDMTLAQLDAIWDEIKHTPS
jgi:tetrapyrrole methylase family protein/MazG family protein